MGIVALKKPRLRELGVWVREVFELESEIELELDPDSYRDELELENLIS